MKKIAIFGGSGGLGKKVCQHLQYLNNESMDHYGISLYEIIPLSSKDVDVRNYTSCKEFFDANEIDVVVNMSGVNHDKFIHKLEMKDQYLINYLLDVNLYGSLNIASTCLPGMRERGYGRLIFISSILSTKVVMGTGLYSSCKAFIDRLSKSISAENISKGITSNSIQLGYFDGGMTDKLNNPEKFKEEIPLKRWGKIEELTDTIDYMIKTEYLTGSTIAINGGL